MDKKKPYKNLDDDDIKGFEEFLEGQSNNSNFLPRGVGGGTKKNEMSFENFSFLTNDMTRLTKVKDLITEKIPFTTNFDQSIKIIKEQKDEIQLLKKAIFEITNKDDSSYKKSLAEIFNSYFSET